MRLNRTQVKLYEIYSEGNHLKTLDIRGIGFYYDPNSGMTNTYVLITGLQTDATSDADITITITMNPNQVPYWDAQKTASKNARTTNVVVE